MPWQTSVLKIQWSSLKNGFSSFFFLLPALDVKIHLNEVFQYILDLENGTNVINHPW